MSALVVTTSVGGDSRTRVWETDTPLALGSPINWVMEKTDAGVRIRTLPKALGQIQKFAFREIPHSELQNGAELNFPEAKYSVRIRPVRALNPLFSESAGSELRVFQCVGNWIQNSAVVNAERAYTAVSEKKPAFKLSKTSGGYALEALTDNLLVNGAAVPAKEKRAFAEQELSSLTIRSGGLSWRFGLTPVAQLPAAQKREQDIESIWFQKSLRIAGIALATLIGLSLIWPKPKPQEELVPPQFAKLVLTQAPKAAKSSTSAAAASSAAPASQKVEQAAVVQAFRAKALQNAVSGLLKGGMTKLIAQSDLVHGGAGESKALFNSKSDSLKASGPATGLGDAKNVSVASLGGGAAGAKGVGYGKGEHASVKGQGGSFVSMDIGSASVEEGLSKDEVGEVIHRHMSEVRYCYESAILRTPDIEGKLIINFTIGGNGVVKSSEIKQSTLPDPRLDDCVIRRLGTWKFPNPKGGVDVAVSYPFIFKTLGR